MRRELGLAATMGTALAIAGAIVVAANWSGGAQPVEEAIATQDAPSVLSDARRIVRNGRVLHTGDAVGVLAAQETGRSAGALAAQPPARSDDDDGEDD